MKANRLIYALLLAPSVAVVQLAAQQTKADQKPIEEVKAKAEAGDAKYQMELGRRYDKGERVAKNPVEAAKWYRKAAEQNLAEAQNSLGVCYLNGEGVAKNCDQAKVLLRAAANRGSREARLRLYEIETGGCH